MIKLRYLCWSQDTTMSNTPRAKIGYEKSPGTPYGRSRYRIYTVRLSAVAIMIQARVISMLDRTTTGAVRVRANAYARSASITSMTRSATPIQRLPHGMSQTNVSRIAREKSTRDFVSSVFLGFCQNATYTQATIHKIYITDHILNVIPAGVMDVLNIFDMSAWVLPPMRYGDPGTLTSDVSPIVMRAVMMRRKRI